MKEINIERLITDYKILVNTYIFKDRIKAYQIKDIDKHITVAMMVYNVFEQASGHYCYEERLDGGENAMAFPVIEKVIRASMYYYFFKIINNDDRDEIMRHITYDIEYDILKSLFYYDNNLKYKYIKDDYTNLFAGLIKSVDIMYKHSFEDTCSNDKEWVQEWSFVRDFESESVELGSFFKDTYGYFL